ncbi:MAG: hypothetical protein ACPG4X_22095 [Pikeienuella sp.]
MKPIAAFDEDIAKAEGRVSRNREIIVEKMAKAADEAGFLDIEIDDATMLNLFRAIVAQINDPPPSMYARRRQRLNLLKLKRANAAKRARKTEDRAKFIVGGYLLAQFKRNPEMAAELTPLIIAYVDQQRSASLRAADKALVLAMIDKHLGQTRHSIPLPPNKANRATIIIGAWLIDAASNDPALADAHGPGIRAFVDAGDTAKGREADRAVVLGVWGVSDN